MIGVIVELVVTLAQVFVHIVYAIGATLLPFLTPKKDISGKKVLVTGAGQGIGALMAKMLAAKGARLKLFQTRGHLIFSPRSTSLHEKGKLTPRMASKLTPGGV